MPSIAPTAKQADTNSNNPHTNPIARLPSLALTSLSKKNEQSYAERKQRKEGRSQIGWMDSWTHTHTLRLLTYAQTDRQTDRQRCISRTVCPCIRVCRFLCSRHCWMPQTGSKTFKQVGRYICKAREGVSQFVCRLFVGVRCGAVNRVRGCPVGHTNTSPRALPRQTHTDGTKQTDRQTATDVRDVHGIGWML